MIAKPASSIVATSLADPLRQLWADAPQFEASWLALMGAGTKAASALRMAEAARSLRISVAAVVRTARTRKLTRRRECVQESGGELYARLSSSMSRRWFRKKLRDSEETSHKCISSSRASIKEFLEIFASCWRIVRKTRVNGRQRCHRHGLLSVRMRCQCI